MSDPAIAAAGAPISAEHRKYIVGETLVGLVINCALSLVFALLVSSGRAAVPLLGPRGMAVDFVPQTFMMTFATTLAVTLLTRRRLRDGRLVAKASAQSGLIQRLPRNALWRATLAGVLVTLAFAPVVAAVLYGLGVQGLPAAPFILMKVVYGAVVTLLIAPPIVRAALVEVV